MKRVTHDSGFFDVGRTAPVGSAIFLAFRREGLISVLTTARDQLDPYDHGPVKNWSVEHGCESCRP